jgi:hypothetical protein
MAKLPENFVKPPTMSKITKPSPGKHARRTRKDLVEAVHDVLVRLSPEQHQALSTACEALAVVGETVTIEDMIKQVIGRWMDATRAMHADAAVAPRAHDPILAQLRRIIAEPVRGWRELLSRAWQFVR